MRPSGRAPDTLRPVSITIGGARHAEGSALIKMGGTEVICTASVEKKVPQFLRGQGRGWITAEYGMLPRATHARGTREAAKGRQTGRTQEIQRLIGRALRASVDLRSLGEIMITLDCDVLNADGGTRCASVTGAWVALAIALRTLTDKRILRRLPDMVQIAAVSCGITKDGCVLDLDYDEDSTASADANFVLAADGGIVEIQGTAEKAPFRDEALFEMMRLARIGTGALFTAQTQAMEAALDAAQSP